MSLYSLKRGINWFHMNELIITSSGTVEFIKYNIFPLDFILITLFKLIYFTIIFFTILYNNYFTRNITNNNLIECLRREGVGGIEKV